MCDASCGLLRQSEHAALLEDEGLVPAAASLARWRRLLCANVIAPAMIAFRSPPVGSCCSMRCGVALQLCSSTAVAVHVCSTSPAGLRRCSLSWLCPCGLRRCFSLRSGHSSLHALLFVQLLVDTTKTITLTSTHTHDRDDRPQRSGHDAMGGNERSATRLCVIP